MVIKKLIFLIFLANYATSGVLSDFIFGNKKLEHYKNGGNLLCKIDKWFTKDIFRYINSSNSIHYYSKISNRSGGHPEGFQQGDLFFDIDDCIIK